MKKSLWASVHVAFRLVGCVPSLHPIYAEEDLNFVPEYVSVSHGIAPEPLAPLREGGKKLPGHHTRAR